MWNLTRRKLAILEALKVFGSVLLWGIDCEKRFRNAILWVSKLEGGPWKFHSFLSEIKALSFSGVVSFSHVVREANFIANSLAKKGVDRIVSLFASIL